MLFTYTVLGRFDDAAVAQEWVEWLRDEHLAEVIDGGALDAEVVELDAPKTQPELAGRQFEVHYHFESREAFQEYERDFAPALRAKGLERFPVSRGVTLERRMGAVVVEM